MDLSRRAFVTGGAISASFACASQSEAFVGFLHKSGIAPVIAPVVPTNAAAYPTITPTSFFLTPYSGHGTVANEVTTTMLTPLGSNYTEQVVANSDTWDFTTLNPGQVFPHYILAGNGDYSVQQPIVRVDHQVGDGTAFVAGSISGESQSPLKNSSYGFGCALQAPSGQLTPLYFDDHAIVTPANGQQRKVFRRFRVRAQNPQAVICDLAVGNDTTAAAVVLSTSISGTVTNGTSVVVASATGILVGHVITGTGIPKGTFVVAINGTTLTLSFPITVGSGLGVKFYGNGVAIVDGTTIYGSSSVVTRRAATKVFATIPAAMLFAGQYGIDLVLVNDANGLGAQSVTRNIAAMGYITTSTVSGVTTCTVTRSQAYPYAAGQGIRIGSADGVGGTVGTITAVSAKDTFTAAFPSGFVDVANVGFYYVYTKNYTCMNSWDYCQANSGTINFVPVDVVPMSGVTGRIGQTRSFASSLDTSSAYLYSPVARVVFYNPDWLQSDPVTGKLRIQGFTESYAGGASGQSMQMHVRPEYSDATCDNNSYCEPLSGEGIFTASRSYHDPAYYGMWDGVGTVKSTAKQTAVYGQHLSHSWDTNYWAHSDSNTVHSGRYSSQDHFYYATEHNGTQYVSKVNRDPIYQRSFVECAPQQFFGAARFYTTGSGSTLAAVITCYSDTSYSQLAPHGLSSGGAWNLLFPSGTPLAVASVANTYAPATGQAPGHYIASTPTPPTFTISLAGLSVTPVAQGSDVALGSFTYATMGQQISNTYSNDMIATAGTWRWPFDPNESTQNNIFIAPVNAAKPSDTGAAGGMNTLTSFTSAGVNRRGSYAWWTSSQGVGGPSNTLQPMNWYYPSGAGQGPTRPAAPATISGKVLTGRGINGTTQSGSPSTTISVTKNANGYLVQCSGALPAEKLSGALAFSMGCTVRDANGNILGWVARDYYGNTAYTDTADAVTSPANAFYLVVPAGTTPNFTNIAWTWSWDDVQGAVNAVFYSPSTALGSGTLSGSTVTLDNAQSVLAVGGVVYIGGQWGIVTSIPSTTTFVLSFTYQQAAAGGSYSSIFACTPANVVAQNGATYTLDVAPGDVTTPTVFKPYCSLTVPGAFVAEFYQDKYGNYINPQSYLADTTCGFMLGFKQHPDFWQWQSEFRGFWPPMQNILQSDMENYGLNSQLMIASSDTQRAIPCSLTTGASPSNVIQVSNIPSMTLLTSDATPLATKPATSYNILAGNVIPDYKNTPLNATTYASLPLYLITLSGASNLFDEWGYKLSATGEVPMYLRLLCTSGAAAGKTFAIIAMYVSGTTMTAYVMDDTGVFTSNGSTVTWAAGDTFDNPLPFYPGAGVELGNIPGVLGSTNSENRYVTSWDAVGKTITVNYPFRIQANKTFVMNNSSTFASSGAWTQTAKDVLYRSCSIGDFGVNGAATGQPANAYFQNLIMAQCSFGVGPNGGCSWWFRGSSLITYFAYETLFGGDLYRGITGANYASSGNGGNDWFDAQITTMNNNALNSTGGGSSAEALNAVSASNPGSNTFGYYVNSDTMFRTLNFSQGSNVVPLSVKCPTSKKIYKRRADFSMMSSGLEYIGGMPASPQAQ